MAGFVKMAGNIAKNAMGGMLKGTEAAMVLEKSAATALAGGEKLGAWGTAKVLGRQAGKDILRGGLTSDGVNAVRGAYSDAYKANGGSFFKSLWAGAKEIGPDTFQKGYGARLGIGAGVGAVAGGAKSYYEGDGPGGYAKNMLGGAAMGAAAGHGYSMFKTPRTMASNLRMSTFKDAWGARG